MVRSYRYYDTADARIASDAMRNAVPIDVDVRLNQLEQALKFDEDRDRRRQFVREYHELYEQRASL